MSPFPAAEGKHKIGTPTPKNPPPSLQELSKLPTRPFYFKSANHRRQSARLTCSHALHHRHPCNELRKAMRAFLESKTRPLPFPSLKLAPNDLLPAKPNLTLPSCFTESTCCRKTLYTGARNSTLFFNRTQAGRKAGRKRAGNPKKTKKRW